MSMETRRDTGYPTVGILLLALGTLALFAQAGLFRSLGGLLGILLFGFAGLYLIRRHYRQGGQLWSLCTGFALLGLGVAALPGHLSGAAFLGFTAAGLIAAYREDRRHWWALLAGGVLLTLAAVAVLDRLAPPLATGPVLFLGLAATFWYLYSRPAGKKRWALYPAVALVVVAVLSVSVGGGWFMPLALIAVGAYLLARHRDGRVDWQLALATLEIYGERLLAAAESLIREVGGGGKTSQAGESGVEAGRQRAEGDRYVDDPGQGADGER